MDDIAKKQEQRYLLLKHLYDVTDGDDHEFLSCSSLGSDLGFDEATTRKVAQYLQGEHLVKMSARDVISITHYGVVQVEQAAKNPQQPTQYFPPIMNMNIIIDRTTIHGGFNVASSIQGSYNKVASAEVPDDLKDLLKRLATEVAKMSEALPQETAEQVARDLETLTAEATSKTPRKEWWRLSVDGLKKAASDIGEIGKPVVELAGLIVAMLMGKQ